MKKFSGLIGGMIAVQVAVAAPNMTPQWGWDSTQTLPTGQPLQYKIGTTWTAMPLLAQNNVWTGTQLFQNNVVAQKTSTTANSIYSAIYPGVTFSDTFQSVRDISAGVTLENNTAVAAYVKNASGSAPSNGGNGVGLFAAVQSVANNSPVWGLNTLCMDNPTRAIGSLTGIKCIGAELDFNIMSPNTEVIGVSVGGNSLSQPATSTGYIVNTLGSGTSFKWGAGFLSLDGVANVGLALGAKELTGANVESQDINLNWRDGSGVNQTMLAKMTGGYLFFQNSGSWNGVAIGGNFTAQGTSAFAGNTAFTSSSPQITLGKQTATVANGAIAFLGATSGTATITAQATAGTPTLTLPNTTGTLVSAASAPLSINSTTGAISVAGAAGEILAGATPAFTATPTLGVNATTTGTLGFANGGATGATVTVQNNGATAAYNFNLPTTVGTTGYLLTSQAGGTSAMTWTSPTTTVNGQSCTLGSTCTVTAAASSIPFPQTVSGTVTSGGIPYFNSATQMSSSALLAQYQLVVGGGAGAAPATLGATGSSGQHLQSGGAAANPSWTTATFPATTTAGTILASGSANAVTATATPTLGASGTLGSLTMGNATSGTVTLQPVTGALGTVTASLPANTGTIAETNINNAFSAAQTITSSSANALAVGANGTTNPAFNVDASTASSATGLNVKSAAAGGGIALSAISSGANETLTIDSKGTGNITIGNNSTGNIYLQRSTTVSNAFNQSTSTQYQGYILSNGTYSTVTFNGLSATNDNGTMQLLSAGAAKVNFSADAGISNYLTKALANSFSVGPNGTTNPAFNIDASTASSATGLQVKSAAAGSGVALSAISSGTNENMTIDAKGSGTLTLNGTATGAINLNAATNINGVTTINNKTQLSAPYSWVFYAAGATAGFQNWDMFQANSGTASVTIRALNDAFSAANNVMIFSRVTDYTQAYVTMNVTQLTGGTVPTIACTGGTTTGASVAAGSTSNEGQFTTAGPSNTACTVSYSAKYVYPNRSFCVVSPANSGAAAITTYYVTNTASTFVLNHATSLGTNTVWNYHCGGN